MSFCKDCASGFLQPGVPTGTTTTLYNLPTYIALPPKVEDVKATIVMIPDAFGWELSNSRLLADRYAEKGGFRVLLPDFMDGHALSHSYLDGGGAMLESLFDTQVSAVWKIPNAIRTAIAFAPFAFYNRDSVVRPRILNFFRNLRASTDVSMQVGVAGFCWGGRWTVLLCSGCEMIDGEAVFVEAGFTAHPSFLDIPGDIETVTTPLSIANGTLDFNFTPPLMERVRSIFDGQDDRELVAYEGAGHGFAVRGNPGKMMEMRQGREAEEQALRWFARFLTPGNESG